jgi:hypothetical protein
VDIWGLLFERKDKEFPDEKGEYLSALYHLLNRGADYCARSFEVAD